MQYSRCLFVAFLVSTTGWSQAQTPESPGHTTLAAEKVEGRWITEFELRIRGESWDWFAPASGGNDYGYAHARLRARLGYKVPDEWEGLLEVQDVQMLGLPGHSVGAGSVGQMGLGASLFAHSGLTSLDTSGIR